MLKKKEKDDESTFDPGNVQTTDVDPPAKSFVDEKIEGKGTQEQEIKSAANSYGVPPESHGQSSVRSTAGMSRSSAGEDLKRERKLARRAERRAAMEAANNGNASR